MKKAIIFSGLLVFLFAQCVPYKNLKPLQSMDELEYPYKTHKQQLSNDIELAYMDEGQGDVAIFVHGLGSYAPAWKKNIEQLKNNYRCIAIDLPGYGKSSKNPHSGMMSFYASVVKEFADSLKLKQFTLAGHSMGGQISMMAAILFPERVENLILVAPAGFERFHEGQKEWFKDVMSTKGVKLTTFEAIELNLAYNFYNMPKDAEFMITDRMAMRTAADFDAYCYAVVQSVGGMVDEPLIDKLDQIKQPTLIVFGQNDNLIPNRYLNPGRTSDIAQSGAAKIKNSVLVLLPKTGHFAQFEQAEKFNEAVQNFLK